MIKLMTIPDAAKRLDISAESVRNALDRGRIAPFGITESGILILTPEDVEVFRQKRRPRTRRSYSQVVESG